MKAKADDYQPVFDAVAVVRGCFEVGIRAVLPDQLIHRTVILEARRLCIGDAVFDPASIRHLLVVGAGKASGCMAAALEEVLGERVKNGVVVVKYGHNAPCRRIKIREAAHPYPDQAGVEATHEIMRLCDAAEESDLVIGLWSGGGSTLLADVPEGCTLEEVARLSTLLVKSGADIAEINAVRKHLSYVKGGQLTRRAYPARNVNLLLSDVVGDPLDVIASGPTVADPTTFGDALAVLHKYRLDAQTPACLLSVLENGAAGKLPETPKPGDPALALTSNSIIGSNRIALEAAAVFAKSRGCTAHVITDRFEGNTVAVAKRIVAEARRTRKGIRPGKPVCLLYGGETALRVTGNGIGGRNQHLALSAALLLDGLPGITLLAGGTDGTDGPTDVAGAVVDGSTCAHAAAAHVDGAASLRLFDSYRFFERVGGHVKTGPTRTNVMDLVVVIVSA